MSLAGRKELLVKPGPPRYFLTNLIKTRHVTCIGRGKGSRPMKTNKKKSTVIFSDTKRPRSLRWPLRGRLGDLKVRVLLSTGTDERCLGEMYVIAKVRYIRRRRRGTEAVVPVRTLVRAGRQEASKSENSTPFLQQFCYCWS